MVREHRTRRHRTVLQAVGWLWSHYLERVTSGPAGPRGPVGRRSIQHTQEDARRRGTSLCFPKDFVFSTNLKHREAWKR